MSGRRRVQCSFGLLQDLIVGKMVRNVISDAPKDAKVVEVFRHTDDWHESFSIILESDEWEELPEESFPPDLIVTFQDISS